MNIKDFPKSEKKLQEFLRRNLEAFQKNVMKEAPVEIMAPPEIQEEWVKKYSEVVLTTEPYTIISFLDENDINIIVDKIGGIWLSKINNNLLEGKYSSRVEAEISKYEEAFQLLENTL